MFAYCGFVVEIQIHLAAIFSLPFQRQPGYGVYTPDMKAMFCPM